MVKRIKTKYIYMSFLLIIILIGIVVLPTYAKFPSNYVTSNDVVGLNLSFDVGISNIEEYQEIKIPTGKTKIFNVKVSNSSGALAYYGVWYRMNTPNTKTQDITIARLGTTETTTSGSLNNNDNKTISVIIKNNTDSDIIVDIGVNSSTTSTTDIEYLSGKRLISGVSYVNNIKTLFASMNDNTYFKVDTYREKILNVSFVDYVDLTNAIAHWDISERSNGSIIAWVTNSSTTGFYDLYIGSNEKIYAPNLQNFFSDMLGLQNISFDNLDTSTTTNMKAMFGGALENKMSLTTLDLSSLDTSSVTNMMGMFHNCDKLTSLDLSNFNTSKVTDMSFLFRNCTSLTSLDLSSFDTSSVVDMNNMFQGCSGLTNLNISSFYTKNVTNMYGMFTNCSSLTTLDVSNFDTRNVTNMRQLFGGCTNLTSLDLSNFDTSSATDTGNLFNGCNNLSTTITITNPNTTNYANMFKNAATIGDAQIIVDYTEETSELVDLMIATKSANSDVIKRGTSTTIFKNNAPNLDSGNLIPVYYDNTAEVWKKADSTNTNNSWYDYESKMWANAVIVDTTKKSTYQNATTGTTITDTDIIAFYVWIPRYKYRVWNITRQGGAESTYAYPAYSTGIEIEFEEGTASTDNVECVYDVTMAESNTNLSDKCYYNGSTTPIKTTDLNTNYPNAWYTHPAFTFGDLEKEGFWIGKFETSGTADAPTVIPDVSSLRSQTLSVQFTTSKKFQAYLSSAVDAHMLTSLEWGAVAYLTHSTYGLCTDNSGTVTCRGLYNNNSAGVYTGRSGGAIANGGGGTYGTYNYKGYELGAYGAATTTKDVSKVASTTGNITGVYDMSGGTYERVMANMVNSSGAFYPSSSGTSWNGSTTLNSKYYTAYSYGTSAQTVSGFNRARLGDATAEVLGANNTYMGSWKIGSGITGSDSTIVANTKPWYTRGGVYNGTNSGLFNFIQYDGSSVANVSFRSSIS